MDRCWSLSRLATSLCGGGAWCDALSQFCLRFGKRPTECFTGKLLAGCSQVPAPSPSGSTYIFPSPTPPPPQRSHMLTRARLVSLAR